MNTPITHKLIVLVVSLAFIGFLAYNFFTTTAISSTGLTDAGASEIIGADILTLVQKLNVVSFDPSIFSSNLFANLKDFSVTLIPEQQGRINPFAPIGQ